MRDLIAVYGRGVGNPAVYGNLLVTRKLYTRYEFAGKNTVKTQNEG